MESLIPPELTLNCSLSLKNWIPKSTGEFLLEVSRIQNASEKISKLDDYLNRLQDEMKKIDAFKRELPLCMLLLKDAIARMMTELIQCKSLNTDPIMEEFIPLKIKSTDEEAENVGRNEEKDITNHRDKVNWMSSVQLWISDNNSRHHHHHHHHHHRHHHHHPNTDNFSKYKFHTLTRDNNRKRKEEVIDPPSMDDLFPSSKDRKIEKAFEPLKGCSVFPVKNIVQEGRNDLSRRVTELSLSTPEINSSKEEIYNNGLSSKGSSNRPGFSSATNDQSSITEQTTRKPRRCWSQELHRRFVGALQLLGGPEAATPKQIRDLMQVEGLTNDEVKSHLQKYRLHTRRVAQPANPSLSTFEPGGLWVSREDWVESSNSKPGNSKSGSPEGPLQLNDSMEDEEEDEKSESHSWKSRNNLSKRVDV